MSMSRSAFIPAAVLLAVAALALQGAWAQTPQQMEYERQQREYRLQQEQQRQEQQRQQQQMNENARRQQEESRRLNAPAGQSPTPGYQGATPMAPQRPGAPAGTAANSSATDWVSSCSSPGQGGTDIYVARSTIHRSGNLVKMWDMYDFKTTQVIGGYRVLSARNQHEYDCKAPRWRMLSTTGFAGHMGKGAVVAFDNTPTAWERFKSGDIVDVCYRKIACGTK